MLTGTKLTSACYIANSPEEYIQQINSLVSKEFSLEEIENRKKKISSMDNAVKTKTLIDLVS